MGKKGNKWAIAWAKWYSLSIRVDTQAAKLVDLEEQERQARKVYLALKPFGRA